MDFVGGEPAGKERRAIPSGPTRSKLGMERLLMFVDRWTDNRIPWNTGLKHQIELGNLEANYPRAGDPEGEHPMVPLEADLLPCRCQQDCLDEGIPWMGLKGASHQEC